MVNKKFFQYVITLSLYIRLNMYYHLDIEQQVKTIMKKFKKADLIHDNDSNDLTPVTNFFKKNFGSSSKRAKRTKEIRKKYIFRK